VYNQEHKVYQYEIMQNIRKQNKDMNCF